MFEENLSIRIYMNDTLFFTSMNHFREDYRVVKGGW